MLPLVPFTPEGVTQKTDALYALSDTALAVEANSIRSDFRSWMNNNFILDSEQHTFLSNLSDDAVSKDGEDMSFCFTYRLPVLMIQNPPETGLDKYVHTSNTIETEADDDGNYHVSGAFIFTILYK